jgi:hypothetical protein
MQKIYFVNDTIIGIYLLKWYVPTLEFYKKREVMRLGRRSNSYGAGINSSS